MHLLMLFLLTVNALKIGNFRHFTFTTSFSTSFLKGGFSLPSKVFSNFANIVRALCGLRKLGTNPVE